MPLVTHLPQRLARGLLFAVPLAAVSLALAGRSDLPMLDTFVVVCAGLVLVGNLVIAPDLQRERRRRGQTGEDPRRLAFIRALFLVMYVFGLVDVGRSHWSDRVPPALQMNALALSALFLARTAHEDRFLRGHLAGYAEYAARVRFRLLPGVW